MKLDHVLGYLTWLHSQICSVRLVQRGMMISLIVSCKKSKFNSVRSQYALTDFHPNNMYAAAFYVVLGIYCIFYQSFCTLILADIILTDIKSAHHTTLMKLPSSNRICTTISSHPMPVPRCFVKLTCSISLLPN